MFGEDFILGEGTIKIDGKGRIIIPAFANPEENDKVILETIKRNNEKILKIHIYKKYCDILNRFIKLRDNSKSIKEFFKYEKEIEDICNKLNYIAILDTQHRIMIPKPLIEDLSWDKNTKIQYKGLGTSLELSQKK